MLPLSQFLIMENIRFYAMILILTINIHIVRNAEENLASKLRAERMQRIKCGYDLKTLWTAELAHAPFAASPLITHVNDDQKLDIVAAPFSESFSVLDSETGKILPNTAWPALNLDNSVHASPIQFDVNNDGQLDILFATSSAEFRFYTSTGLFLRNHTLQLPPIYVAADWYKSELIVKFEDISKYTSQTQQKESNYLPIDPHVLATPVLADLNNDYKVEELVIPVSYFYEEDDYRVAEKLQRLGGLNFSDIDKYLVAGIIVMNLTTGETLWSKLLDLTQVDATFPAYNIFSPTVIDLDVVGGQLEVIMGTSAGSMFVFNHDGSVRKGWPVSQNTIHGQITAADLAGDGVVQMVTIDTSSNVICYDKEGTKRWESIISGTSSPGSRLFDVNRDGTLDIIITTNDGHIYALNGVDGTVLPDWPVSIGARTTANVLITRVSTTHTTPDMVVVADDGSIHLISMDLKCKSQIPIGETSLVQVLSHDLSLWFSGLELLVATNDGTVVCLATGQELAEFQNDNDEPLKANHLISLTSDPKTVNDFSFSEQKPGIYVTLFNKKEMEVTGETFPVEFEIIDPLYKPGKSKYFVAISYGNRLLMQGEFPEPKTYTVSAPAGEEPSHGHVTVRLTNQYGQVFEDRFSIRFNKLIMEDLQWLLLAPFIAMIVILLVLHGFPAKDLLPYTNQSKSN
uniref:Protein DEFECTIVE IN EXINE FORMATION 1-like n=1 Tax=Crassostrea virginica TaxID=6565 RepID=A0A8B8DPK9_CRAVI|nr:protein DEFECTIVE IN EXINE FORMATION 1-like [Crassostrea virginica]